MPLRHRRKSQDGGGACGSSDRRCAGHALEGGRSGIGHQETQQIGSEEMEVQWKYNLRTHEINAGIANIDGDVYPRRVVAPVSLLQL